MQMQRAHAAVAVSEKESKNEELDGTTLVSVTPPPLVAFGSISQIIKGCAVITYQCRETSTRRIIIVACLICLFIEYIQE
jgi:hypothetical protein